jgi:hypothetical protein
MSPRRSPLFPLLGLAALLLGSLVLAACGSTSNDLNVKEGQAVELGGLRYNVQFSRFLNIHDVEDRYYLTGQPQPTANQLYLGVFLLVKNVGDSRVTLPTTFTVTDTLHHHFVALPSKSDFAFPVGTKLDPDTEAPDPNSPAGSGPIQGALVVFRMPDSVTENRPLTLEIPGPGGPAKVELDI